MKRFLLVAAISVNALAQLNPTVKVLQRPTSAVPTECAEGLAPQPPLQTARVTPEERTTIRDTSRDMQAPPSATLRSELQTAVEAAQHSSREAFQESLQRAKAMLGSYPPGGERTAATDLVNVLDDLDKVWDYEFNSPTGAFFDVTSEPYKIASKYPGYEAFVRRQVIVDQNGNKFYPSHETRDFLLAQSGDRYTRVTGKSAAPSTPPKPVVRSTGVTTTKPRPAPTTPKHTTTTVVKHTKRAATTHHASTTTHKPVVKKPVVKKPVAIVAKNEPPKSRPKPTPAPTSPPKPAVTTSSAATETETPLPTPPPVVATPATTSSSEPTTTSATASAPVTDTTTATTTPVSPDTAPTATTTTTATANPTRSFVWPIFMIIVGVGVLVMLWRASS